MEEWINSIIDELKMEFNIGESDTRKISLVTSKVNNAVLEVKQARSYPTNMSETDIDTDLQNYANNIRLIAEYDYAKIGANGQQAHNENGVNRTWIDRAKCFNGVFAYAKVI